MGVGELTFEEQSTLILQDNIISPFKSVVVTNKYYINRKLGILFRIPESWYQLAVKDFGEINTNEGKFFGERTFAIEDPSELSGPAILLSKYDDEKRFSPQISLYVYQKDDLEENDIENIEALVDLSAKNTHHMNDFKLQYKLSPFEISNCQAYEYNATYTKEIIAGVTGVEMRLKITIIEHHNHYYFLNMVDSAELGESVSEVFYTFISSILLQ